MIFSEFPECIALLTVLSWFLFQEWNGMPFK